jgi:ABC-type antimicrobial peptide transport system permease subunit
LIGLPLTFVAGRLLGDQLYGANPYNPLVTLAAVLTLGLSALVASVVPAFRASRNAEFRILNSEF